MALPAFTHGPGPFLPRARHTRAQSSTRNTRLAGTSPPAFYSPSLLPAGTRVTKRRRRSRTHAGDQSALYTSNSNRHSESTTRRAHTHARSQTPRVFLDRRLNTSNLAHPEIRYHVRRVTDETTQRRRQGRFESVTTKRQINQKTTEHESNVGAHAQIRTFWRNALPNTRFPNRTRSLSVKINANLSKQIRARAR